MYYHASQTNNIKVLEPRISNHKKPLIYFSDKRENILVYLSNAVERVAKETNFKHEGVYSKWGPYCFDKEGKLVLEEYYPNATEETYKGVSGYIYHVKEIPNMKKLEEIPNVYITDTDTKIDSVEYIEDAYDEIMKSVKEGKIRLLKFDEFMKLKEDWLIKTIKSEYEDSSDKPEYRHFLETKFSFILNK